MAGGGPEVVACGSGVGTLRSGAGSGWAIGVGGAGVSSSVTMLVKVSVSCCRASLRESVVGAIGERGLGRRRALAISRRDAMMMSLLELSGMVTVVGNQDTVSQMRGDLVSWIQMR